MPGGLTIEHDNTRTSFAISGGILQITGEKVIVLGELVEKIDGDHQKAIEIGQELAKKAFPAE
jgi:F0F1-type ATP synthase epsilon subunit